MKVYVVYKHYYNGLEEWSHVVSIHMSEEGAYLKTEYLEEKEGSSDQYHDLTFYYEMWETEE